MSSTNRWYVGQTLPQGEAPAAKELRNQDFIVFLPLFRRVRAIRGMMVPETFPIFPGYLFVSFDIAERSQHWRAIRSTRGMRGLLPMRHENPVAVPAGHIERWRKQADAQGCIDVGAPDVWRPRAGEMVRMKSGPWVGLEALCTRSTGERINILIDILGGPRDTVVRLDQVEIAGAMSQ